MEVDPGSVRAGSSVTREAVSVVAEGRTVAQLKLILEGFALAVAIENECGTEGLVDFVKIFRQIIEEKTEP